jgi:hypothetical protein
MNEPIMSQPYPISADYPMWSGAELHLRRQWWLFILASCFGICMMALGVFLGFYRLVWWGCVALAVTPFYFIEKKRITERKARLPLLHYVFAFEQGGLRMHLSNSVDYAFPWSAFVRVVDTLDAFLLYRTSSECLILPKSVFDGGQVVAIKRLLRAKGLLK